MPQLDLYSIQPQFICLIVSLFFIYNFLLKYALSTLDAFNRLKLKKIHFFKSQNKTLNFFSLVLKKKTIETTNLLNDCLYDICQICVGKLLLSYMNEWYKEKVIQRILKRSFLKLYLKHYIIEKFLQLNFGELSHRRLFKYKDLKVKGPFEIKKNNIKKKNRIQFKKFIAKILRKNFNLLNFAIDIEIINKIFNRFLKKK